VNVLIVAGAGTSMELGVPGMVGLAEEFIEHSRQWHVEPDLVQRIVGASLDIEHLIEEIDRICSARESFALIGQTDGGFEQFDKIRAEVEWFIQHSAERVLPRDAHLMWGSVLRAAAGVQLTIVTTNYDRAIELAANAEDADVDDGFGMFGLRETAIWQGFGRVPGGIHLVKLHGSTDWYVDNATGSPTKLRHPMPLFGRAALRLPDGGELGSALILPSREKLLTRDPYPRLSQAFLNAADSCDVAIVIGSSLRDHHLRGGVQSVALRVPVFIVNPEGDALGIPGAIGIPQFASAFLVGTLPRCLVEEDIPSALRAASKIAASGAHTLQALRIALDTDQPSHARCRAIEELDAWGAGLDAEWVTTLLSSPDPHVARHALGLIPLAPQRGTLASVAAESPHAASDTAYQEDLLLLDAILTS
jgi:NAD-dependent SIR2 family protein deacetylase